MPDDVRLPEVRRKIGQINILIDVLSRHSRLELREN